jgi:hypothetical protein
MLESQDTSETCTIATESLAVSVYGRVRKIAKSDCWLRHICPSVLTEQLGFHWTDFHEIRYLSIFVTYVEKIQVSQKSDIAVLEDQYARLIISRSVLLRTKNVAGRSCKRIKTHILCSVTFFRKSHRF